MLPSSVRQSQNNTELKGIDQNITEHTVYEDEPISDLFVKCYFAK